jgi:hypothetical protein
MKAPMILPWVARRAGISEELALKLWRRAASEAEIRLGTTQGSDYHSLVSEYFLSLADDESPSHCRQPALSMGWTWRQQQRISRLSMLAAQNVWCDWNEQWQDCYCLRKAA